MGGLDACCFWEKEKGSRAYPGQRWGKPSGTSARQSGARVALQQSPILLQALSKLKRTRGGVQHRTIPGGKVLSGDKAGSRRSSWEVVPITKHSPRRKSNGARPLL